MAKYRYSGRPGKHTIDGASLKPGDVLELSELQAEQCADRFERA